MNVPFSPSDTLTRPTLPDAPPRLVAVVPWPSGGTARARARALGEPCLLVLDPGAAPPADCDRYEDWVAATASTADVAVRLTALAGRVAPPRPAPLTPEIEADLSDLQIALFDVLDGDRGRPAPRERLVAVLAAHGAADDDRTLERTLRSLRRVVRRAGLDLVRIGRGDVLLVNDPNCP